MKQTTQKVVLGCALAITLVGAMAPAHASVITIGEDLAATASANTITGNLGTAGAGSLGGYNRGTFVVSLSKSVALTADGNDTMMAASTSNKKGMHVFGASTNGGKVQQCEETSLALTALVPRASFTLTNVGTGC
jgi:hypothetical protein